MCNLTSELNFAGLPSEVDEDSKFVPLNPEDPRYGPPVSKLWLVLALASDDYVYV